MKVWVSILKWWRELWNWDFDEYRNIDSHRWESKIEAYRSFSGN